MHHRAAGLSLLCYPSLVRFKALLTDANLGSAAAVCCPCLQVLLVTSPYPWCLAGWSPWSLPTPSTTAYSGKLTSHQMPARPLLPFWVASAPLLSLLPLP